MKTRSYMSSICVALLLSGCVTNQPKSVVQEPVSGIGNMQVIGQAEYVTVQPAGVRYRARIDSGATTCSMSALDIKRFERDGEKWVRFRLPIPSEEEGEELQKSDAMEYPISRIPGAYPA